MKLAEIQHVINKRKYLNPLEWFKPLTQQAKFKDCPAKIKGAFGGNRSGKTEEGAEYVITKCLAKPKQRWWACAETLEDSREIQQRKVWSLLPKNRVKYCYYDEVNGFRNRKIIFDNGSQLHFKSYEQGREGMQGTDQDGIWDDEEPPYDVYREQRMRLIDRDGEMIFTMTSLMGVTELLAELFEDYDVVESKPAPLLNNEVLPTIVRKGQAMFFMFWTTDNPHVSQSRLEDDVKIMTKQDIRSRIYGLPINLSGRIYPMFNKDVHVVPWDIIPKTQVTIYNVLDPHDRKPWALQWWVVDKMGRAFCIREYPWNRNFNDMDWDDKAYADYARLIKATELEIIENFGRSVSKRIIDPNFGNSTERKAEREGGHSKTTPRIELKRLGLNYRDGIDNLAAGHLQVRKWLYYQEAKDSKELVVKPKLYIYEGCQNTIRHLSRYAYKDIETASGDVRDKVQPQDKYKDYSDTTRYFVMANPIWLPRFEPQMPNTRGKMY